MDDRAISMACGLGEKRRLILSTLLALAVLMLVPRAVALLERVVGPRQAPSENAVDARTARR